MFIRKKKTSKPKSELGKLWYFIWEDNSLLSWLVNILLAFVLIKFLVYPGLGLVLNTSHPVVAVVSNSMEHNDEFDKWWNSSQKLYGEYNITREDFINYKLSNGFNMGDIMVLRGSEPQALKAGDVIVFFGSEPDPIIHRVVDKWEENGKYYFRTKGDNNQGFVKDELRINEKQIVGKAWFRLPLLGYVKIIFTELLHLVGVR
jgi:signal peptidase I